MLTQKQILTMFGEKLRILMEQKHISANKLSIEVGVDRASIGKYISGETAPRLDNFLTICDVLNVQPNYFFGSNFVDYSTDESKTEECKIIESLYCLCKHGLIEKMSADWGCDFAYGLPIYYGSLLYDILLECKRFAGSNIADDFEVCKKIVEKYESALIEKTRKGEDSSQTN